MYAGRTMEYGTADQLFYQPTHPYTRGLLSAIPRLEPVSGGLASIPGDPPNLLALPPGCPFQSRCAHARPVCQAQTPPLQRFEGQRQRACNIEIREVQA